MQISGHSPVSSILGESPAKPVPNFSPLPTGR
jgi:hypothetical protein